MKRSGFKKKPCKMKKSPLKKRSKKLTIPRLRDKVCDLIKKHVKETNSVDGWCICITCGKMIKNHTLKCHGGHYIHGKGIESYLDERNIHVQCSRCNLYLKGNMRKYERYMQEEYGQVVIDELEKMEENKMWIWKRNHLEELLEKYKKLGKKDE